MSISEQEIRRVAELANLALTDDEIARMARDLSGILTHMDKLNELDTTGVEPMAQVLFDSGETATLREDRERARSAITTPWPTRRWPAPGISKFPR